MILEDLLSLITSIFTEASKKARWKFLEKKLKEKKKKKKELRG